MESQAIIALISLVLKYGGEAVLAAQKAYSKPLVELEDVEALEGLVQRPQSYFEKPGGPDSAR